METNERLIALVLFAFIGRVMKKIIVLTLKVILLLHAKHTANSDSVTSEGAIFIRPLKSYIGVEHVIWHDGLFRWFVEYPPPPDITMKPPLLILLHFGGGNMQSSVGLGRLIEKDPWLRLCYQYGFLAIAPNAVARRKNGRPGYDTKSLYADWNDLLGGRRNSVIDVDDVGFITSVVDWAVKNRNADPNRVYIFGVSNGGTMAERMVIERPYLFAGAATIVANLPERDVPLPTMGTPIFLMFGTADTRMPYAGGDASGGARGMIRSAEATRDYFVAANNAGPKMVESLLPDVYRNDNCTIVSQYFPHNTTPVIFYRLQGGGHNPSGIPVVGNGIRIPKLFTNRLEDALGNVCYDADSTLLAWEFMSNFTLADRLCHTNTTTFNCTR
jgi:polyhydroxybutyrate depolymerase